jgi:tetratricopeptide (TPR) repeat protein
MATDLPDQPLAATADTQRDPLECLAEEFLERRRQGADVSIDDYAARHPELAGRIRDLFPALLLLEDLKPAASAGGAGVPAAGELVGRLGDFRVLREIGRGGMGVVYEAVQESLGRRVALKLLPPAWLASDNRLRRFLREAQAAARLHHTNIVPVFGVGQQDGLHYYVMQFIAGQGLDKVPPPVDPCDWRGIARIGVQAAEALDYAHRQGVLHRDIKPANLLLDEQGVVWIADFGLAKLADVEDLTHPNDTLGTLRYMAPEQFAGQADARSDVYGLGLTLYELLVRRPAFDENDRGRLIRQITQAEPPRPRKLRPDIPRDLETIVVKATASRPEHRYQTAGQLAADLQCFLEDRPIRARRISAAGRLWRCCRRNRAMAATSGAALALLLAVALVASIGYLHTASALRRVSFERSQADLARKQAEEERTRTKAQRERAETNLRLATKAFEDIFGMVACDPIARTSDEDDEDWPGPAAEPAVSDKDAALLESMLKFYDQFAEENRTDVKLQRETARAYRRVGDIQRHLGQYERAETAYRHALAMYQAQAAPGPPLPPGEGRGEGELTRGAPSPAPRALTPCPSPGGRGETSPAAPGSGESADHSTATAAIHNDLGVLFHDMGRLGEARDCHRQALQILQKETPEAAAGAESRFELARTLSFLSTPLWAAVGRRPGYPAGAAGGRHAWGSPSERLREAVDNNHRALELLAALVRDAPDNPKYRLAMARSQRDRYLIAAFGGHRDEAGQAKQEAVRILEKLIAESPHNPTYRCELAETYATVDFRNRDKPTAAAAVDQLRQAVRIAADLVAQWAAVPAYKVTLAQAYGRLAQAARSADLPADAREAAAKAVGVGQALAAEFPKVVTYRFALARSLQQQAELAISAGQPAQARASLEAAIAEFEKLPGPMLGGPGSGRDPLGRRMLAAPYAALAKVLRGLGEDALADAAAAKAGDAFPRPGRSRRSAGKTPVQP